MVRVRPAHLLVILSKGTTGGTNQAMRQLPLSGSVTLVLSAQIALDAHEIRYVTCDPLAGGLPVSSACILVDDDDYERACAIVADLQDTRPTPRRDADDAPVFRIFVNAVVSGIIFFWLMLVLHH